MSLCKASLPSQCSLSVLSVPSLDATANHRLSPSDDTELAEKTGATESGFPTMVAGMAPGAQSGPVTVSITKAIKLNLFLPFIPDCFFKFANISA